MKYKINIGYTISDQELENQGLNVEEYTNIVGKHYRDFEWAQVTYEEQELTFKDIEFYEKNNVNKITFVLSEVEEIAKNATILRVNKEAKTLDISFEYGIQLYATITLDRVIGYSLDKEDPMVLNLLENSCPLYEPYKYNFGDEPIEIVEAIAKKAIPKPKIGPNKPRIFEQKNEDNNLGF